jgi:RNA polymerase sigma-70 factor (ECF subfamily)
MVDQPALELTFPAAAAEPAAPAPVVLDEEAFRTLYGRTAVPLRCYLRRLTGDPELADDLLQESFHRLLRRVPAGLDEPRLTGWLYRTATRLAHDAWRRARRQRRWLERTPAGANAFAPSWEPAPGGDAALSRRAVEQALGRLAPRERALLWLAHVEGWEHREIAGALGLAPASIRVLLFRARRRMARLLGRATDAKEVLG